MTDLEKTIAFLENEELYYLEECEDLETAKHYGRVEVDRRGRWTLLLYG